MVLETWQGYDIGRNIRQHGDISMWSTDMLIGYPRYVFEGFFSYFELGVLQSLFPIFEIFKVSNHVLVGHLFIAMLGMYAFTMRLKKEKWVALLAPSLLITITPWVALVISGHLRQIYALSFAPLAFCITHSALKDPAHSKLLSMLMVVIFFFHPMLALFVGGLIISAIGFYLIHTKKKIVKPLLYNATYFVGIVAFWLASFVYYRDYMQEGTLQSFAPLVQLRGILSAFATRFTIENGVVLIIAAIGGYLLFTSKDARTKSFVAAPFVFLLLYVTPLGNFLPAERIPRVFVIMLIPFIIGTTIKKYKQGVALLLLVVFCFHFHAAFIEGQDAIQEQPRSVIQALTTSYLEQNQDGGRVAVFGDFVPTAAPLVQIKSNHPVVDYGLYQGQHMDIYKKIRDEQTGQWFTTNQNTLDNYLHVSNTKYLYIYSCKFVDFWNETHRALTDGLRYEVVQKEECREVMKVPNTYFAEVTTLISTPLTEEQYYTLPFAWKAYGLYNERKGLPLVEDTEDLSKINWPRPLNYHRPHDEAFTITSPVQKGETIVVKEQYFPRWHAYQNGQKVPIQRSMVGNMLITVQENGPITFRYKPDRWEVALVVLALLTVACALGGVFND